MPKSQSSSKKSQPAIGRLSTTKPPFQDSCETPLTSKIGALPLTKMLLGWQPQALFRAVEPPTVSAVSGPQELWRKDFPDVAYFFTFVLDLSFASSRQARFAPQGPIARNEHQKAVQDGFETLTIPRTRLPDL